MSSTSKKSKTKTQAPKEAPLPEVKSAVEPVPPVEPLVEHLEPTADEHEEKADVPQSGGQPTGDVPAEAEHKETEQQFLPSNTSSMASPVPPVPDRTSSSEIRRTAPVSTVPPPVPDRTTSTSLRSAPSTPNASPSSVPEKSSSVSESSSKPVLVADNSDSKRFSPSESSSSVKASTPVAVSTSSKNLSPTPAKIASTSSIPFAIAMKTTSTPSTTSKSSPRSAPARIRYTMSPVLKAALDSPKQGLKVFRAQRTTKIGDNQLVEIIWELEEWPEVKLGHFVVSSVFVVVSVAPLNTQTERIAVDVHVWFGRSSVDKEEEEMACLRVLGLNDFSNETNPTVAFALHRETQGRESGLFRSYFKHGLVLWTDFEKRPRMFHVKNERRQIRAEEVPPKINSLNEGDVFILDLGDVVYVYNGRMADPLEKSKAAILASTLKLIKGGAARVTEEMDDYFWGQMGGRPENVVMKMITPLNGRDVRSGIDIENCVLYRHTITGKDNTITFIKVHQGRVFPDMLSSQDAYVLDAGAEVFFIVGLNNIDLNELKSAWFDRTDLCMRLDKKPRNLPITRVLLGEPNKSFDEVVYTGKLRKGWLARSFGLPESEMTLGAIESTFSGIGSLFRQCTGEREIEDKVEKEWNLVDRKTVEEFASASAAQSGSSTGEKHDSSAALDTSVAEI